MKNNSNKSHGVHLMKDQASGVFVQAINEVRMQNEQEAIVAQDTAFETAVEEINKVREFLSKPQHILGSESTKHGEIAEQVDVGIRNARQALSQLEMLATFDGVHRTGPVDYLIDGVGVQSKFINGVPANLNHVLVHLDSYQGFTADGSYYVIPKDVYEAVQTILNGGHIDGLRGTTEDRIKALVTQIQEQTGKPFNEVVQPSVANYSEVQVLTVSKTLDNEQQNLDQQNQEIKDQISDDHAPSLQGAAGAAMVGAAVGGTLSLASAIYAKHKAGKNFLKGDFVTEDWKDVGIETTKGAAGGTIAAGGIYLMTNYADMAAPFAAAVVSAAKGVSSLAVQYRMGGISFDEFVDLGIIVCAEAAIVGVSTAAGQALIPVPILGAVIGSLAGKMLVEFAAGQNEEIAKRLREYMQASKAKLDDKLKGTLEVITEEFNKFTSLTEAAFDFQLNISLLERSVALAKAHGVDEDKIITDRASLDRFITT